MFCFQVVTASKFIMRKESTRDYADLLLSTKHWPVVLAVDMACDVVAPMHFGKIGGGVLRSPVWWINLR